MNRTERIEKALRDICAEIRIESAAKGGTKRKTLAVLELAMVRAEEALAFRDPPRKVGHRCTGEDGCEGCAELWEQWEKECQNEDL